MKTVLASLLGLSMVFALNGCVVGGYGHHHRHHHRHHHGMNHHVVHHAGKVVKSEKVVKTVKTVEVVKHAK